MAENGGEESLSRKLYSFPHVHRVEQGGSLFSRGSKGIFAVIPLSPKASHRPMERL